MREKSISLVENASFHHPTDYTNLYRTHSRITHHVSGSRPMLRRSRRFTQPDYWILAVVGILCLIGVLMVFSSSGVDPQDPNYLIGRHVQWLFVGGIMLLVTMSVPYTRWRQYSVPGIILAVLLLALVLWG